MNSRPIGIFDSGVGGLSVFSLLSKILPDEDYIYYGDTANLPYGDKTKEELTVIAGKIFEFFKEKNVKAVVMACNTTSATVYEDFKDKYDFKIYPLVQSVAKSGLVKKGKRTGVFATNATINSHAYKNEIQKQNPDAEVFEQACPKWVYIVENNLIDNEESRKEIKSDLDKMLENKPERIILGCTHYPFLTEILKNYAPGISFINPGEYFAKFISGDLSMNNMFNPQKSGKKIFYVSGNRENFISAAELFYKINPEDVYSV